MSGFNENPCDFTTGFDRGFLFLKCLLVNSLFFPGGRGVGVAEVRSLTGFPRRGKAAPFYPRQLTSKGASPRPQLSTPPHSILRVARACSCQSPPSCRMYVERPDVSFSVVAVRLSLDCPCRLLVEPERTIFLLVFIFVCIWGPLVTYK